jgi:hypothetical protein
MQNDIFSSKSLRLLPMLFALAVLVAPPASAQEDDDGPNALQKMLGAAGILDLPKDPIDYQERAPLVVPPSAVLPPPGNPDNVKKLNPEWPTDHDLKKARTASSSKSTLSAIQQQESWGGRALNPDQLSRAKPGKSNSADSSDTAGGEANRGVYEYKPSALGFLGWGKKKDDLVFNGEPDRTSLLEPPPGYRTPSPNAPYGVVEEKKSTTATTSVYDRLNDPNAKK